MKKKLISLLLVSAMAAATAEMIFLGKKSEYSSVQPEIRMPQSMKRMMAVR